MDFRLDNSDCWGTKEDETSDILHDQLFGKVEFDLQKGVSKKKKKCLPSKTQSCQNQSSSQKEFASRKSTKVNPGVKENETIGNLHANKTNSAIAQNSVLHSCSPDDLAKNLKKKTLKRSKKRKFNTELNDDPNKIDDVVEGTGNNYLKSSSKLKKKVSLSLSHSEGCANVKDIKKTDFVNRQSSFLHTSSPEDVTKTLEKKSHKTDKKRKFNTELDDGLTKMENITKYPGENPPEIGSPKLQKNLEMHEALTKTFNRTVNLSPPSEATSSSLYKSRLIKENAMKRFQSAKFRLLNEKLYTVRGDEAFDYFNNNTEEFEAYHEGYKHQVAKWPINPVDIIIQDIQKGPREIVIADLGCGEAKIARVVPHRKVFSFDIVALNEHVTCCDISKVPLANDSVDIAVFCLSLMGVNSGDYLSEAHRILKFGGLLKIAEVESRIPSVTGLIYNISQYGFELWRKDVANKMFSFLDFKKIKREEKKKSVALPTIKLKPCIYKRR